MPPLVFDNDRTLAQAEIDFEFLGESATVPERIKLPAMPRMLQLGAMASTLQVLATWAHRANHPRILRIDIDDDVEKAAGRTHLMLASQFAHVIEDGKGDDLAENHLGRGRNTELQDLTKNPAQLLDGEGRRKELLRVHGRIRWL